MKMATIKEAENNKYRWGCGEIKTLCPVAWVEKIVQPLWKTVLEVPQE